MFPKTLIVFCIGMLTHLDSLLENGETGVGGEIVVFPCRISYSQTAVTYNVLVVAIGIFFLNLLWFLLPKECSQSIDEPGQEKKNARGESTSRTEQQNENIDEGCLNPEKSSGEGEAGSFEPAMLSSHPPSLDSSSTNQQPSTDRVLNNIEFSLGTIEIDRTDFPSTLMDTIDLLSIRTTSLEISLNQLRGGQAVEQLQPSVIEEAPPFPSYQQEGDDDKVPLPSITQPVARNRVRLDTPVHVVHQPPAQAPEGKTDKDPGLANYAFYVGVSVALGIVTYRMLGRVWR